MCSNLPCHNQILLKGGKVHALANYQRACICTSKRNGFIALCNDIIQVSHR